MKNLDGFSSFLVRFVLILMIFGAYAGVNVGQSQSAIREPLKAEAIDTVDVNRSDVIERMRHMESKIETLQRELGELKRLLMDQMKGKKEAGEETNKEEAIAVSGTKDPEKALEANPTAVSQQKSDIGVDIGSARLTPYGSIYFNGFYNTGGSNNADVPLFATPTGRGGTSASLRQTRLGIRLEGAKVGKARLNAVLEADFFGGFPSVGIGENFGVVRLRLANVRLDWEKTSVTVGQDWSIFAPLSPTSLAAAAIPQMAAAGNNWARLPQLKVETKIGKYVRWQGAVTAPQTGDSATNAPFFLQPNSGSASNIPFFQSRLAISDTNLFGTKKPGHVAFSGHYGRSRIFTGVSSERNDIDSVGIALDWNLPLHERFGFTGEAFYGQNMAGFQGGIFQGYNGEFAYRQGMALVPGGVRAIRTRGGWAQFGYTPPVAKDRLAIYGSFGIDDPRNDDLVTFVPRDLRIRNFAVAFNTIYKFSPQFSLSAEYRRFYTDWVLSRRRTSDHVNFGAVYTF